MDIRSTPPAYAYVVRPRIIGLSLIDDSTVQEVVQVRANGTDLEFGRSCDLRTNIDAIITHEYEELRAGGRHADALKAAAKTALPISEQARRLNRARTR